MPNMQAIICFNVMLSGIKIWQIFITGYVKAKYISRNIQDTVCSVNCSICTRSEVGLYSKQPIYITLCYLIKPSWWLDRPIKTADVVFSGYSATVPG